MNISIILAAGNGTRMKSKLAKPLHRVCNKPILEYVINASQGAETSKTVIVVGEDSDSIKEAFAGDDISFKTQKLGPGIPYGTGYAVIQAIDEIQDDSQVLILYGDTPLITSKTINKLFNYHKEGDYDGTVLTAELEDPSGYGRIIRTESGIERIVEDRDCSPLEKEIKEINSGIYCFKGGLLKEALSLIDNDNDQNEYYITDVIEILRSRDYKIGGLVMEDPYEIYGVNSRDQLAYCEAIMRERINSYHMENGVSLIDPRNTYIDPEVEIARDTVIYPNVFLEGRTKIGEDCKILSGTRIVDSVIMDRVVIESSLIEESYVAEDGVIGPFAHLRPKTRLGKRVKLGNFVEVKNSNIGDDTKASHLAYIGDGDVGSCVNIGCGVVFVNYDGRLKHRTKVGDNAFIGSNSNLIGPVEVRDWGYVAAGSTITDLVDEGDLSIARAQQVNKKGWVEKKGLKD